MLIDATLLAAFFVLLRRAFGGQIPLPVAALFSVVTVGFPLAVAFCRRIREDRRRDCPAKLFGSTDLDPRRARTRGVVVRTLHGGAARAVPWIDKPRAWLEKDGVIVAVSLERRPRVLASSRHLRASHKAALRPGVAFVARNHDLLLRHYRDTVYDFDDEDLRQALRERGEYR